MKKKQENFALNLIREISLTLNWSPTDNLYISTASSQSSVTFCCFSSLKLRFVKFSDVFSFTDTILDSNVPIRIKLILMKDKTYSISTKLWISSHSELEISFSSLTHEIFCLCFWTAVQPVVISRSVVRIFSKRFFWCHSCVPLRPSEMKIQYFFFLKKVLNYFAILRIRAHLVLDKNFMPELILSNMRRNSEKNALKTAYLCNQLLMLNTDNFKSFRLWPKVNLDA